MKNIFLAIALLLLAAAPCFADLVEHPGNSDASITATNISSGQPREKIALLPFYNLTDNVQASQQIMFAVKEALISRGFEVADGEALNEFLCNMKVRLLPHIYISKDLAGTLRKEMSITKIFTGSIVSFTPSGAVHAGLLSRVIDTDTGAIVWADHAFVSGDDYMTILGLGEIRTMDQLLPKVVSKLFSSLETSMPLHRGEKRPRVAVPPFANKSTFPAAGMLVTHLFIEEIFKQGLMEPVEFGDVKKALADVKAQKRGDIEYKKLEELSNALSAERLILGTVEQYLDGETQLSPLNISISARLLDAGSRKILWYNSGHSTAERTFIAFEQGDSDPADIAGYRAVEALIKNMNASLSR